MWPTLIVMEGAHSGSPPKNANPEATLTINPAQTKTLLLPVKTFTGTSAKTAEIYNSVNPQQFKFKIFCFAFTTDSL
jgi:hypothetical protein